jgi:poly(hydroxyalkanoate) depolymerase family esterase
LSALPGKWLASSYAPPADALAGALSLKRLQYWLYLPDRAPALSARGRGWPLVVMLHGCEQTATQFAQGTRMNRLAERKGFAVLYPQQALTAHARRCWKWYDKATQEGGGEAATIAALITKIAGSYTIDRSRIYIGGMSAGAGMANIVALRHPELIAAVGLHSGPAFGAGHSGLGALSVMQHGAGLRADSAIAEVLAHRPGFPQMPAILIQGQGDRVVRPINQTHLMRQSLMLNRAPAATAVTVVLKPGGRPGSRNPAHGHQIHDFHVGKKLLLRVAQIEHLEHAWSGGDASLSFNAREGPDASRMMVEFFAKHRRAALSASPSGL